jgi:predicted PurR-regulated permease PerM
MVDRLADERYRLLRHPIAVGFSLFLLFGVLHLLGQAVGLILLGFLAVLLATLLSFPIDFFSRFMPRVIALLLTVLLVLGLVVGVALLIAPVLAQQASGFAEQVPVALTRLSRWWEEVQHRTGLTRLPGEGPAARLTSEAAGLITGLVPFAFSLGTVLATGLLIFVLALVFAYDPKSYHDGVRALLPREREPELDEAWHRLGVALHHWVGGVLISMTVMGTLAALGLWVAGIQGWFLLGILTFFGTFVPYVGAIASAVPGLIVGLAQSPTHFLYAFLVYVGVHIVEGYLVSPFIMKHSVHLRPGWLLFWQLLAGAVFGLPGIVVATPLLACAKVAVGYFYVERRLGKDPEAL